MSKIKSVEVAPGCISCGTCEAVCPSVFKVVGTSQVDQTADFEKNKDDILEAEEICPVSVIKVVKEAGK